MILAVTAPAAFAVDPKPIRECPPEHRLTTPRELTAPPDVGTTREVLSYAELTGWQGIQGLALRIRRITVEPGGYVPLHYHHERPSVDYIIQGELTEYNSFCAVPIVHRKGDSAERFGDFIGHWWKNESTETVILVSADVVPIGLVNF
jgi:quercetin dioxygenase-like cupin family protein